MTTPTQPLNWLFIDMDCFFASVERHLRPELRERPVGVVPVESDGTCVIAASMEAKRRGVKTGTGVREARRLCPGIALVKARPAVYVRLHHDILRSVDRCAPVHKVYSIDEWSIRLLGEERRAERAVELARAIKRQLLEDFSPWLTGSIGIAPTRLLAKTASDLDKPDGLVTLGVSDLPHRLEHLRLNDLPGIAEGILRRLNGAGVRTVRELWALSRAESRRIWGSVQGEAWWAGFHGLDEPEQATRRRTMSHANMLAPEFRNDAGAHGILARLVCKGASRLRHDGYVAHRLHVSVRSYGGRAWQAEAGLPGTQDTLTILREFERLWSRRAWANGPAGWEPFSQVAMTLSGLAPVGSTPGHLFAEEERGRRLSEVMDRLHRRWGRDALYPGCLHGFRHEMEDKIAFGRVPDELIGS